MHLLRGRHTTGNVVRHHKRSCATPWQQDIAKQVQEVRVLVESKASTEFAARYGKDVQDRVEDKTSAALLRFENTLKDELKEVKQLQPQLIKLQASFDMACTLGGAAFAVPLSVAAVVAAVSNLEGSAANKFLGLPWSLASLLWVTVAIVGAVCVLTFIAARAWEFWRSKVSTNRPAVTAERACSDMVPSRS